MNETWKILIITVAATLVAGAVAGVCIGKYLVRRAKSGRKRLLSAKERVVYSVCVLLGAAMILFGVFYKFPSPEAAPPDGMITGDGEYLDKGADGGVVTFSGGGETAAYAMDIPEGG